MHEDRDSMGGRRERRRKRIGRQRDRFAAASNHHRAGEWVSALGQLIAVDPVDRGDGGRGGIGT